MPPNAVLGATIETDRDEGYGGISKAPPPSARYEAMRDLNWPRKLVSIEPVLDFDLEEFVRWVEGIKPSIIYVGYDNYANRLPEPPLGKTLKLIGELKSKGFRVYAKTLRRAWWEK